MHVRWDYIQNFMRNMKKNCIKTKIQKGVFDTIIVESNLATEYDPSEPTIDTIVNEDNFGDLVTIKTPSIADNELDQSLTTELSVLSTLHGVESIGQELRFSETSENLRKGILEEKELAELDNFDSDEKTIREETPTTRKNSNDNFELIDCFGENESFSDSDLYGSSIENFVPNEVIA
jgi:hypothetical protein